MTRVKFGKGLIVTGFEAPHEGPVKLVLSTPSGKTVRKWSRADFHEHKLTTAQFNGALDAFLAQLRKARLA